MEHLVLDFKLEASRFISTAITSIRENLIWLEFQADIFPEISSTLISFTSSSSTQEACKWFENTQNSVNISP